LQVSFPFGFTLMSRPRQSSVLMVVSTRDPSLALHEARRIGPAMSAFLHWAM
jgi:hypothetical protein